MNHCRRCESDYEKPGTCNCFAEAGTHVTTFLTFEGSSRAADVYETVRKEAERRARALENIHVSVLRQ